MINERFLQQDPEAERYRLGLFALDVGSQYLAHLTRRQLSAPHLSWLMVKTHETVPLCTLNDGEILYCYSRVARIGHHPYQDRGPRDSLPLCDRESDLRLPIVGRGGLGAVSRNAEEDSEDQCGSHEISRGVARRGKCAYAISLKEGNEYINAVAAPIFDHQGNPAAGITVSGLAQRLPADRLRSIGVLVKAATDLIWREIEHRGQEWRTSPVQDLRPA